MPQVYLSIGSNQQREQNIRSAITALRTRYGKVECSTVYESTAVGFDGDDFYNLVARFETGDSAQQVNEYLKEIEQSQGRDRNSPKFSDRSIDLDLLLWGDLIEPLLDIPRAEIADYAFVLRPLSEMAPDELHPQLGRSYHELWQGFDQGSQSLWPVELVL